MNLREQDTGRSVYRLSSELTVAVTAATGTADPSAAKPNTAGPATTNASSFDAFHDRHHDTWARYAYANTGSREVTEEIVDALTEHLSDNWDYLVHKDSAAWHAWKVLKATVARWLNEHEAESSFTTVAAFDRFSRLMTHSREQFDLMEEKIGLYSAISRLSERQHDTVVLRYVLGCEPEFIAAFLGVTPNTVHSNLRYARKNLAKELGTYTTMKEA